MKQVKRIIAIITIFSMVLYYCMGADVKEAKANTKVKNYIIITKSTKEINRVKSKYKKTDEINENSPNLSEKIRLLPWK